MPDNTNQLNSNERIIGIKFDYKASVLADIFQNQQACAIWCLYRDRHIISQNGLAYLNDVCREVTKKKLKFNIESAREFLKVIISHIQHIEYCAQHDETEWIEKTIPYLTGEKSIKLEIVT